MLKVCLGLLLITASSSSWAAGFIYDTAHGQRYTLEQFASACTPGEILVLGETHAVSGSESDPSTIVHHNNQARLLRALTTAATAATPNSTEPAGLRFHVTTAMEFLTYTRQAVVDQYVSGQLAEGDFLKQAGWNNGNPFAFYRQQILEPAATRGHTVALNIPSAIAAHVAQNGPGSLSASERALLPPLWERGGAQYFARFQATMEDGHIPPEALERYFWAQSLWDDTMAWNALKNLAADPLAMTVVIVGEFHVDFGQGLPARLHRQSPETPVKTLLQIEATSLDQAVVGPLLEPDATYGTHADYLWVHTLDDQITP